MAIKSFAALSPGRKPTS